MKNEKERLLSTNEVARLLRIHPNTVRNMLQDGRLQAIKTRGKTGPYRFRETDVQAYLDGEGEPELFEQKKKDSPFYHSEGALEQIQKQSSQFLQDTLDYLGECANPFHILGSYLETLPADQYSRHLAGKAAIWAEETLRQAELRFDHAPLAIFYPGTKDTFIKDIGVGIAAKKGKQGNWLLTSVLVYPAANPAYLLDGTLQQFHPEMEKGVILLRWEEKNLFYTGLEIISPAEFQAAVIDRNGTYFQAFLQKIKKEYQN